MKKSNPSNAQVLHVLDTIRQLFRGIQSRCTGRCESTTKWYRGRKIDGDWVREPIRFVRFCLLHGWSPNKEIDRINNLKGYTRSNCRFVSHTLNQENRNKQNDKGFDGRRYQLPINIIYVNAPRYKKRYKVVLTRNGKRYNSGMFMTVEEAVKEKKRMLKKIGR